MPNYPTGRIFDGYRGRVRVVETMQGIRVVRTWLWPSNSARALPRLVSYFSFVLSSLVLGAAGVRRQDIVFVESPPLFLVPAGLLIARLAKARVVLNVSDVWPETAARIGLSMGRFPFWLMQRLERLGYQGAHVVTVTTPAAAQSINARFPHIETAVILPGIDLDMFKPSLRSETRRRALGVVREEFLVGYCGLHGLFQGLEVVLEAAERLRERSGIKFVLVGDGPTKASLVELATRRNLDNVVFVDSLPRSEIPPVIACFDAALVPLAAELPGTMPSKVYETLACGVPLIVSAGSEAEPLVVGHGVGRTFRPRDGAGLADAVVDLAESPDECARMRQDARELAKRFDVQRVGPRAEAIFEAVSRGDALPGS